ncbi:MAG: ATP-dependent Clp protease proteolytic subunit [Oscillospiraceae bacterium]|jgi:ATP-dependent protease ClpP protease subunit|nr:ATP-dependent Clp protease proteolytic subunit [Oscillospiraceae bacterium]
MKKGKSQKNNVIVSPFRKDDENDANDSDQQMEDMNYPGSIITSNGKYKIYCLTIIGEVEGHNYSCDDVKTTKYECVIPQLIAVEQDPKIDGMLILLNTMGGDVEAGLALAEIISGMAKPSVSVVIGGGHSIGVPLAVAANKSFIAKSASMMLHPVRMNSGNLGIPQTFQYFQRMQNRITNFVCENSHIKPKRFKKLVTNTEELSADIGSVLDGDEAVNEGIIDYVGTISDAFRCLYSMIDKKPKKPSKTKNKSKNTTSQKRSAKTKRNSR